MSDIQTLPLFPDHAPSHLTVEDVANQLNVSTASVRNWIKAGYFSKIGANYISEESFLDFKNNVAGNEKLTKRANKSFADFHNHDAVQSKFLTKLSIADGAEYDTIGSEYEAALSNSYRNKEGVYYTPNTIANTFFEHLPKNRENIKFCDPCCGSGNFLIAAIENGIHPSNLYGYDVDPVAVEISRRRVFEKTGIWPDNIICLDFLETSARKELPDEKFDAIFTNPPWGKKFSKNRKEFFSKSFNAGRSVDTCSLFFFASCMAVKRGGYVGLLMPDSFFNVATYYSARKMALSYSLISLTDFGKPFQTLLTKAKGIVIKLDKPSNDIATRCKTLTNSHIRLQSSFRDNPKAILNFNCPPKSTEVIDRMIAMPHVTLSGQAKWGLGIVTGNNSKFIKRSNRDGYMPVYKGKDILKGGLKEPSNYLPRNTALYQQVPPLELFLAKEKLIYKFISSELCFYHDKQQRFFINSANMLILNNNFPLNHEQLCDLLNSNIMNWFFQSIFETHKILRSDLECLPIHFELFKAYSKFDEAAYLKYLNITEDKNGTYRIKKQDL